MSRGDLAAMAAKVERMIAAATNHEQSDRELLERFAGGHDQAAFAALVERHGSMVQGVCRRVLGDAHEAEDAFQAAFLVLARKAGSVAWRESIRTWLYNVACRVAIAARHRREVRRRHERAASRPDAAPVRDSFWGELCGLLDEELQRLPEQYRTVLVLCGLEGKSHVEAAEELGWSSGSVKGRLERGRDLLRRRLVRRGLPVSAGLLTAALSQTSARAAVPSLLVVSTARTAAEFAAGQTSAIAAPVLSLTKGALNAMFVTKVKLLSVVGMFLVAVGLGTGVVLGSSRAADDGASAAVLAPVDDEIKRDKEDPKKGDNSQKKREEQKDGDRKPEEKKDGDRKPAEKKDGDERREGERLRKNYRGTLKAVDAEKSTVTVTIRILRDGDPADAPGELQDCVIPVGREARVTVDGRPVKLSELKVGETVDVRTDFRVAVLVSAGKVPEKKDGDREGGEREAQHSYRGVLKAVDAAKGTITFTVAVRREGDRDGDPKRTAEYTLPVADEARILALGKPVKLAELKAGDGVEVRTDRAGTTVVHVAAGRKAEDGEREPREVEVIGRLVRGQVKAVDARKGTVTLVAVEEREGSKKTVEKTFDVSITARILVNGESVKLDALKPGTEVETRVDKDDKTLLSITVGKQTPRGEKDGER